MQLKIVTNSDLSPLKHISKEGVDFKDNGVTTYIGAYFNNRIIGCVGFQKIGGTLRYKTDCVLESFRGIGVYRMLFRAREEYCANIPRTKTTAFCTSMSLPAYIASGFVVKSIRNGISFVERY